MRFLFIYPFCSPEVNSISGGPLYLGANGHDVLLITSQLADSLKGRVSAPEHEKIGNTVFYRPYPNSKDIIQRPSLCWDEVYAMVKDFKPDVIFGFGEFNYKLPLRLSRAFKLPLYVYMEYLRPEKVAFPMRGRTLFRRLLPRLHDWLSDRFLHYLANQSKGFMYAYYGDGKYAEKVKAYGVPVHYVPWCNEVYGRTEDVNPNQKKDKLAGIYVGSLAGFKNAAELVKAIPIILDKTSTTTFTVVGPGEYAEKIKQLVDEYPKRLFYKESVPRSEAMKMIRGAGYGFTPVKDCGLGFIGDCWASETPLVSMYDLEGFLKEGIDTLVVNDMDKLPEAINELFVSDEMFNEYQRNGVQRYRQDYTAEAAGKSYLNIAMTVGASIKE